MEYPCKIQLQVTDNIGGLVGHDARNAQPSLPIHPLPHLAQASASRRGLGNKFCSYIYLFYHL